MSKALTLIILSISIMIALNIVMTIPLWILWNWLMPTIFGVAKITITQALGLLMLAGIIFRSNTTKSD